MNEKQICNNCKGPLLSKTFGVWYIIRKTTAMLDGNKSAHVMGDHDAEISIDIRICFDCYCSAPFDRMHRLMEEAACPKV